ncbi:MAG TPA: ABC transporter ATP-binding protein [Pyrinomonadaceae bacterium]|nr:ABC transporter ATP-binding protein [Pyrinomonadaceae bacterium]
MPQSSNILFAKIRKALAQLPHLPRALGLVWDVARPWTIAWILLLALQGLLPAAAVYLTKLVVDGVVAALGTGGAWTDVRAVLILVAALGCVMLAMEVARSAASWIRLVQAQLLQDHINGLIHEKSAEADLAFYEFPDYYDHLHRARSEASFRPVALLENLGSLFQNGITLIAMGAILLPLGPWLSLALVASTLPALFVVVRYALMEYQWRQRTTADERRTWYYDWVLTAVETAAELRLFGLGKHFQTSFQTLRKRLRDEKLLLARRQSLAELSAAILALLITGAALAWMVWKAMHGLVTLGDLALIYAAFNQGQRLMRTLLESVGQLYANSLFLGNLFEFLALKPIIVEPSTESAKTPETLDDEISFLRVSFRYPQSQHLALDDFSLKIPAGRIVALVGPNGAGKSTLVKLLCRFYDPEAGRIEIDQTDIKQVATPYLRKLITVLFQQPVHYNATVRENIAYGSLEHQPEQHEIEAAVRAAGAEEIVARQPEGYESMLGKLYSGGTELSVGEWQRIALARAFLRRAPIIILDEPTSALDPWAEADWLQRFRQLASGRTALVITHRFTTAMYADEIHVMEAGKIVESGTHDELISQKGRYAESWIDQTRSAELALPRGA